MIEAQSEQLIGDKAFDNDDWDDDLSRQGIDMIATHRTHRMKYQIMDARKHRKISVGGDMSASLRGFSGIVDSLFDGNATQRYFSVLYSWLPYARLLK